MITASFMKGLIFFTSLVCLAASSPVSVTWHKVQWSVTKFLYFYLHSPFMIIFIIFAVISYSYIIEIIIRSKETIGKQVSKKEKCSGHLQKKSIIISTIIIETFIVFTIIPNFPHPSRHTTSFQRL